QQTPEETAMIIGAHAILYSASPDADLAFLRDVLRLTHVDVGGGWLNFGLPPAEVAVYPSEKNAQELFLMCDDVAAFIADMHEHDIACNDAHDAPWERLTQLTLPGGGKIGVYQPRHARPRRRAPAGDKSMSAVSDPDGHPAVCMTPRRVRADVGRLCASHSG
ncbi:MAG: hypothetical protein WBW61_13195, partial [Rhodanobacteraceae bacterium]